MIGLNLLSLHLSVIVLLQGNVFSVNICVCSLYDSGIGQQKSVMVVNLALGDKSVRNGVSDLPVCGFGVELGGNHPDPVAVILRVVPKHCTWGFKQNGVDHIPVGDVIVLADAVVRNLL